MAERIKIDQADIIYKTFKEQNDFFEYLKDQYNKKDTDHSVIQAYNDSIGFAVNTININERFYGLDDVEYKNEFIEATRNKSVEEVINNYFSIFESKKNRAISYYEELKHKYKYKIDEIVSNNKRNALQVSNIESGTLNIPRFMIGMYPRVQYFDNYRLESVNNNFVYRDENEKPLRKDVDNEPKEVSRMLNRDIPKQLKINNIDYVTSNKKIYNIFAEKTELTKKICIINPIDTPARISGKELFLQGIVLLFMVETLTAMGYEVSVVSSEISVETQRDRIIGVGTFVYMKDISNLSKLLLMTDPLFYRTHVFFDIAYSYNTNYQYIPEGLGAPITAFSRVNINKVIEDIESIVEKEFMTDNAVMFKKVENESQIESVLYNFVDRIKTKKALKKLETLGFSKEYISRISFLGSKTIQQIADDIIR